MTEEEWQTSTDPQTMLGFLRGKASDRKLRLFACACVRRLKDDPGEHWRTSLEVSERFADGKADKKRLWAVRSRVPDVDGYCCAWAVSKDWHGILNYAAHKAATDAALYS